MKEIDGIRIERGNTVDGVNRAVIEVLLASGNSFDSGRLIDIPCGDGTFLKTVKRYFSGLETIGADIAPAPIGFDGEFLQLDASRPFNFAASKPFTVATCISGVMEFDNTQLFFEQVRGLLGDDAWFIVTNDNLTSVRDRLNYLLFGRFRQYRAFIPHDRQTWKTLSLSNLLRLLENSGFEVSEVKFVPSKKAEWLWFPLAIPIFVSQLIYLYSNEKDVPIETKSQRFPFASLLSRHYVVVCRVKK